MQTQNQRLLDYLKQHEKIDPLTAWTELGIYRLGARVFDLRESGHKIEKTTASVKNRFGETCRVAEYRMKVAGGSA